MDIIASLKNGYRSGSLLTHLIYWNVGIWLAVKLIDAVLVLFAIPGDVWLHYLEMPSDVQTWLHQPWTMFTYMFLHRDLFHLFFNMLCLYWFGRLFLDEMSPKQLVGLYIWGGLAGAAFYLGMYNLLPFIAGHTYLLGASASIMAIIVAVAVWRPNYSIRLLLIGEIRLKYIAIVTVAVSVLGVTGSNAGGELAHLGGALMGALYAWLWRKGHDLSAPITAIINWFSNLRRHRYTRQRKSTFKQRPKSDAEYNQEKAHNEAEIDRILDKIKRSGYQSLSDDERAALFNCKK
ncbi:MAG: rhomboid family intramembrane serine protease [Paludibacteraceae bacterium]|nr:rhomboid family intramembrane serine protease [Paludibacteraceae bacterium]